MRKAGRLTAEALDMLVPLVKPGVTGWAQVRFPYVETAKQAQARIVEAHGGTIAVTDAHGGGARFTFTMPILPGTDGVVTGHEVDGRAVVALLGGVLRPAMVEAVHSTIRMPLTVTSRR